MMDTEKNELLCADNIILRVKKLMPSLEARYFFSVEIHLQRMSLAKKVPDALDSPSSPRNKLYTALARYKKAEDYVHSLMKNRRIPGLGKYKQDSFCCLGQGASAYLQEAHNLISVIISLLPLNVAQSEFAWDRLERLKKIQPMRRDLTNFSPQRFRVIGGTDAHP